MRVLVIGGTGSRAPERRGRPKLAEIGRDPTEIAVDIAGRARRALEPAASASEAAVVALAGGDAAAQAGSLSETAHRPWPLPEAPWLQGQTWRELLFAHWPLPPDALRRVVPPQLPIDTFDGSAWIGIAPFVVSGLRLRGAPPLPALSRFAETNVRTYTTVDGRPGIRFLSLDAASRLAVAAARLTYRLPYHRARMTVRRSGARIEYRARRASNGAALAVDYEPTGPVELPRPGSLEHFLTERYCLYTVVDGRVHRADIHHRPWPLQPAVAHLAHNTMSGPLGIALPARGPLLHYADRQDVVIWPPAPIDRSPFP